MPADYVRKQTLKNAERYITDDLKRYETEVLTAGERAKALEAELFEQLRLRALRGTSRPLQAGRPRPWRRWTCCAALAQLAGRARLPPADDHAGQRAGDRRRPPPRAGRAAARAVRPQRRAHGAPTDDRLLIITGPNMAGKSTYIRQTALLVLLAQAGSFVPAEAATIGLVDRIFTRVGAADELAAGPVHLHGGDDRDGQHPEQRHRRSLVILDEVGRGTSTYDGLALAWAISEHIALRRRAAARSSPRTTTS